MENIHTTPDFTEKVVSFSTIESNLALVSPQFEYQGGRLFVVGTIPAGSTTNDWAKNRPSAIAWDSITDYIVFDNNEQYLELLAKSEED